MAFGVMVSTGDRTYLDMLQPVWYLDFRAMVSGASSMSYAFDTSRFKMTVLVLSWHYGSTPVFTVSGNTLSYSGLDSCTYLVRMENI